MALLWVLPLAGEPITGENILIIDKDNLGEHDFLRPSAISAHNLDTQPTLDALLELDRKGATEWRSINAFDLPIYTEQQRWYRIKLHNQSAQPQSLILDFPISPIKHLEVAYVKDGEITQRFSTGVWQKQSERPVDYSLFAMPLKLEAGDSVDVYLNAVVTPRRTLSSLRVFEQLSFYRFLASNDALYGIHIGLGISVVLFNFILVLILKELRYSWFIVFALGQIAIIASLGGKSTSFFLEIFPALVPHEILFYGSMAAFGIVLFADTIVDMRRTAPLAFKIALLAASAFPGLLLYSVLFDPGHFRFLYLGAPALVIFSVIVYQAIKASLQGDVAMRLLAIGLLLPLAALVYLSYSRLYQDLLLNFAYDISLILLCLANLLRIGNLKRNEELALLASDAKSTFISELSHEVRNPMNGIVGMSQLLMNSDIDDKNRKRAMVIHQSASSLLDILNDVLDYSKISANKMELERIPFELHSLVMTAAEIYRSQCELQDTTLNISIDPDLPQHFYGDPSRINQILSNLLSNAVKFTEGGVIDLSVYYHNSERNQLAFSVKDNGIGISREQLQTLFRDYEQATPSIARQFGGTGLGLPICLRLARLMKGEILVDSEEGKGSQFTLVIPLSAARDAAVSSPIEKKVQAFSKSLNILYAEDNTINSQVLSSLLENLNCTYSATTNGREAVNAYINSMVPGNETFDCIIMDCEMPVLGGIEAAEQIRAFETEQNLSRAIPILALTGHVLPEYEQRCLNVGMNQVLTKPLSIAALRNALGKQCLIEAST